MDDMAEFSDGLRKRMEDIGSGKARKESLFYSSPNRVEGGITPSRFGRIILANLSLKGMPTHRCVGNSPTSP
jgi:hypothetical protein